MNHPPFNIIAFADEMVRQYEEGPWRPGQGYTRLCEIMARWQYSQDLKTMIRRDTAGKLVIALNNIKKWLHENAQCSCDTEVGHVCLQCACEQEATMALLNFEDESK